MISTNRAGGDTSSTVTTSARTSVPGSDRSQLSTVTRRGFLGTLAAVAVGTMTGCSMGGATDLQEIGGGTARRPSKPAPGGDNAPYAPTQPYQLSSTCELSEDYFLVQNHLIDPAKDTVVAYSRSDGLVEAIVLQDGVVKQIYRDPTQAGGWKVLALPDTQNVTSMAAAVSDPYNDPKRASLQVYYTSSAQPDLLTIASQPIILPTGGAAPTFSTETVPWSHSAGPLQVTLNADNTPLVAAMVSSTAVGKPDARMYYCTDCRSAVQPDGGLPSWTSSGYLTGFEYFITPNSANFAKAGGLTVGWSAVVAQPNLGGGIVPWMTLYLPSFAYSQDSANPVARVWAATLMGGRLGATSVKDWRSLGALGNRAAVTKPTSGYVASIEFATVLGSTFEPTLLVRIVDQIGSKVGQRLTILTRNDQHNTWTWTELPLPDPTSTSVSLATATRPVPTGETGKGVHSFLDVFLVSGTTLSVIRQAPTGDAVKDGIMPSYTPVLPLQDQVALMTSQPGVSTGNELMLVGSDGTLQSLEKDPVAGSWTDTVVHLPADEMQQDSAYRVTLTLADAAWNMPVAGQELKITASTPAVATIEGPSPRTVVLGADTVTVTTGSDGQATLALLATGLSAPTLTITGTGLPAPVTVYPSGGINAYMQGVGSLNYLQPMTADTLTRAKTPDGQTVAPGATDAGAASEAVTNMKQAADWAAAGVSSGRISSTVRRHDHVPARRRGKVGTQDPGGVLDHWAQDALHAIKKGAVAVKTITKDAEHKAFVFATDVADWADREITIAVQGIEDAAHVLHAVFNKLKADIWHAVKWLEAEVIGVFRSAKALSDKFETWIGKFTTFAAASLASDQTKVTNWLKGEQQWITTEMTTLAGRFSPKTTLSSMAANPPGLRATRDRARPRPRTGPGGPAGASDDAPQPPHGDWFYRKIKHERRGFWPEDRPVHHAGPEGQDHPVRAEVPGALGRLPEPVHRRLLEGLPQRGGASPRRRRRGADPAAAAGPAQGGQ